MDDSTRILIIEDDPDYAELVRRFLADSVPPENLTITRTLKEALETDGQFGVILADLVLPDAHELNVVRRLREKWPHTPIVAMSGMIEASRCRDVMEAGAQDFLLKDEVTNAKRHLARVLGRAMDRSDILAKTMKASISSLQQALARLDTI